MLSNFFKLLKTLFILSVFVLFSCASLNSDTVASTYFIAFEALKDAVLGNGDDEITKDLVERIPYASAKLKIGRSKPGLVILEGIKDKKFTWVSSDEVFITVENGRIIRTVGLFNNVTAYRSPNQSFKKFIENDNPIVDYFVYYSYDKPFLSELKIQVNLINKGLEKVSILGEEKSLVLIEEHISNEYIGWKEKNQYWLDPNDFFVWKSIQHISPKLPQFSLEVTKKPAI